MNRFVDEAYVLRTQELGESDLIVGLFAAGHGKVRGVARSARRSRRRFGGALEPLTRVRAHWTEKAGRELHRIDEVECLRSFAAAQGDPLGQAAGAVLVETVEQFAHEGQPDAPFHRLVGAVLEALDAGGDPWALVRYFQLWTLRVHGLEPDLDACGRCGAALGADARRVAEDGEVVCATCAVGDGALRLGPDDLDFLRAVSRRPPAELPAADASGGAALDRLLAGGIERFTERPLRTHRHLRALRLDRPSRGLRETRGA